MTYPKVLVDKALSMVAVGMTHAEISRRTGISRATIRGWSLGETPRRSAEAHSPEERLTCPLIDTLPAPAYAYLLGLYLGDGTISNMPKGVFRLRIFCCDAYPHLMDLCQEAMEAVLPGHKVGRAKGLGCTEVSSYSKHWPCLFPQYGPGMKHLRPIILAAWQCAIVDEHPKEFLPGLVHSDGCRSINPITALTGKKYFYPRYEFTNVSDDIKTLFCLVCDLLEVRWKVMNRKTISINKRADVAFLDTFIGPKT